MNPDLPNVPDRIQWHEGMLLCPQHFQQMQARTDALGAWYLLAAQPLAWGVRRCEIDLTLLNTGLLRVDALEAVLPDGTLIWHDARDARDGPLEIDLGAHAETLEGSSLDIHLTLPRAHSMRNPNTPSRFRGVTDMPVEDDVSDSEAADLPRLRPNLGLTAGQPPSSLWQSLRLCSVVRHDGLTQLNDNWPATPVLERAHPLWQRAWALCSQLRAKAAYLARQSRLPSSRQEDRLTLLEQKTRLGALLSPLPGLEALLQSPGVSPYNLYLALCSALGPLATLSPGGMPILPPAYDHASPRTVFEPLLKNLEAALGSISQEHRLQPFDVHDGCFVQHLPSDKLAHALVVGLRGQPEKDLVSWMEGAVIGSDSLWASLLERRVLGAARRRIEEAPALGLRGNTGYTLFEIDVQGGLIVADENLKISNANETHAAQRPHEIVLFAKG